MKIYKNIFEQIISPENLFLAWDEFKRGKQDKFDVQRFEWNLEQNIFELHRDLESRSYRHGPYESFYIRDPKQRHIHKATVRDRVLHHAVFASLNPIFEPSFISHSFSCRIGKGTHKAVLVLEKVMRKASKNNRISCLVLKCDIKKFFDTVDHHILLTILKTRIKDIDAIRLLEEIIGSYISPRSILSDCRGLPIGNLTSQLFANIYLNKFDQFIKHKLQVQHYLRYTDDFLIIADDKRYLLDILKPIRLFLREHLALELHEKKMTIHKFHQGIDFVGYSALPHYCVVRTATRRRMFKKLRRDIGEYRNGSITRQTIEQSFQSYLGVLSHANAYELSQRLRRQFLSWLND